LDPIIKEQEVVVTETRIIRKDPVAQGGSMKFYFVGLIVFLVAAVGIVAMLITTCRRDTVRMTVNSAEI